MSTEFVQKTCVFTRTNTFMTREGSNSVLNRSVDVDIILTFGNLHKYKEENKRK
jgi:hypothetical protein